MSLMRTIRGLRRTPWAPLSALWVVAMGVLAWQVPQGTDVLPAFAVTPALSLATGARRRAVLASGTLALAALGTDLADDSVDVSGLSAGAACTVLAVIAAGMWTAGRRSRLSAELARTREIAVAAQHVLLRPLPRRVGGVEVSGEYLSASHGARVGGDFYEVLATPFGVRALIGDARGHGLPAIGLVAALLGSFREAAHHEQDLAGVVHRLDGAMHRHLSERPAGEDVAAEEFATVQLVQLTDDGGLLAVNCGHPPPYLLGTRAGPLALGEPLPPLGLFDPLRTDVTVCRDRLAPGEGLLLYTDGVPDARDGTGRFFPLPDTLAALAAARVHDSDVAALLRAEIVLHTGDHRADDIALLVLSPTPASASRHAVIPSGPGRPRSRR
ncbi:SpoIIE family protein phosphatase [Streptomyces cocklensis]|jgi:serine phosphatase RsbU (regulator of sigma subunit)|uniref:Stage II sporulation protein E (SpoIIE) n=1 Tax=Actinacidiphila cocklensis TaxID=887465 RepID=A0A9W4GV93_9ACTN|nr:SpoIIE family protein phosphatase [Actinacidiphila cocklensis]MDD1060889.1 SpoIIE family protein phosphatase [Actinacidiphila cocklensis]CAG6396487.1 Stage II sporulation protein E (SpoIIE) [Actinacidiphila cocklensis]